MDGDFGNERKTGTASPVPVFVLGIQGSGTTWLANVLAWHPAVAAVQSTDHYGVHESIFFSHFARAFGDLDADPAFERFAAAFTASDYFRLTGLDPAWFAARRPRTYAQAFALVMDELARRDGAGAWVEKSPSHTLIAGELLQGFPEARLVGIVRAPDEVVAGALRMRGASNRVRRTARLVREAARCSLYQRSLLALARERPESAMTIAYEDLKGDPPMEVARVCEFAGIEFDPAMLEPPWQRNTSHAAPAEGGREDLAPWERLLVRASIAATRPIPLRAWRRRELRRHGPGGDWPEWCWRRHDADRRDGSTRARMPSPRPVRSRRWPGTTAPG